MFFICLRTFIDTTVLIDVTTSVNITNSSESILANSDSNPLFNVLLPTNITWLIHSLYTNTAWSFIFKDDYTKMQNTRRFEVSRQQNHAWLLSWWPRDFLNFLTFSTSTSGNFCFRASISISGNKLKSLDT